MFVPRSVRRIRFVRAVFVLVAVLPCAALVAWAVQRHSAVHRDSIRRTWEQAVGLPLVVESVEHPLPGVIQARRWSLAAADGRPVLDGESVAVEISPSEVRMSFGVLDCDPAGAAVLAGLASEWLWRGARFQRDVVIDVGEFAWKVPCAQAHPVLQSLGPLRIECVAQDAARAVRIVRRDSAGDEVRIVRPGIDGAAGDRLDVEATCTEPLPLPILAAIAGSWPVARLSLGDAATIRGRLTATWAPGGSSGTASGRIGHVDLAACTAALSAGATGTAAVEVRSVEWRDGRLAAAAFACDAGAGRVDQRLLDALVATVGCRAGAASVGTAVERERTFDAAGCEARIDGRGIELSGAARLGGSLAAVGGRPLLDPPAGFVPPERLAWLLAAPGAVYVPSSGPGTWLMSVLPRGEGPPERTSRSVDGTGRRGL